MPGKAPWEKDPPPPPTQAAPSQPPEPAPDALIEPDPEPPPTPVQETAPALREPQRQASLPGIPAPPAMRGMGNLSRRDTDGEVKMLRIIHQIRKKEDIGKPGQFKMGREVFDELRVVILDIQKHRALLEGEGDQKRTTCASMDGEQPMAKVQVPKSEFCSTCQFYDWTTGTDGRRHAPACSVTFAFLLQRHGPSGSFGEPFWFVCGKTAARAAQEFIPALNEYKADDGHKPLSTGEIVVRLTTAHTTNEYGGSWYLPVFTIDDCLPPGTNSETQDFVADWLFEPRVVAPITAAPQLTQAGGGRPQPF